MSYLIFILTVLVVIVSLLLILVVLMQRPKQEGLGAAFGAGVTDQMWGAQTTNVLQKFTTRLTLFFFIICLALCMLVARNSKSTGSKLANAPAVIATPETPPAPAATPGGPALPVTPLTGNAVSSQPIVVPAPAAEGTPPPAAEATPVPAPAVEAPAPAVEAPAPAPAAPTPPQ